MWTFINYRLLCLNTRPVVWEILERLPCFNTRLVIGDMFERFKLIVLNDMWCKPFLWMYLHTYVSMSANTLSGFPNLSLHQTHACHARRGGENTWYET